jgi:hypothetical protein
MPYQEARQILRRNRLSRSACIGGLTSATRRGTTPTAICGRNSDAPVPPMLSWHTITVLCVLVAILLWMAGHDVPSAAFAGIALGLEIRRT